jgi:hypothetical protein
MATTLEKWSREEVRGVVRILWAKHVYPVEIHRQMIEVYGDGVMSVQHVRKWCREFERTSMMTIAAVGPAHQGQM